MYPQQKPLMSLDTARVMIRKALDLGRRENVFVWQGGEPTLMGLDFYRHVVGFQREFAKDGQVIGNALQTNGVLIDHHWAEFFAENRFLIGLSLDGPKVIHDTYRKFPSGKGSFDRVMLAAKLLRKHGVEFNILTLLTQANVSHPEILYRFFRRHGFSHLQFIPCFETDPENGNILPFSISADDLGKFHCKIFDLWLQDGFSHVSIRFLEDILIYYIDGIQVSCNWSERCGSYLLVEHNGDVYPCDFFVSPEWKLGNIVTDSVEQIANSPLLHKFAHIKSQTAAECKECRWVSFCYGDCMKFRLSSRGNVNSLSVFCSARKMLLDHMEPHLESIKQKALKIRQQGRSNNSQPITRNSPCPCGSGLKYKKCCGK